MAPPKLARDAPVVDVIHPVEIDLFVILRRESDGLCTAGVRLNRGDSLVGKRLNLDKPLRGEARLDNGFAAVAVADVVDVVLDSGQETLCFEVGDDLFASRKAIEAGVWSAVLIDMGAVIHDVDGRKMVALADGEVIGVVRRRDLDGAGAEIAADPRVENDGNLAVHERQAQLFAVEMQIPLVLWMDGDGGIAEHGFRARGRDGEKFAAVLAVVSENRIPNLPEVPLLLGVNDFEIADGGLAAGAPVDDVRAAVDKPLLVETNEGFPDCDRQVLVHREVFALPVDGDAEALHLLEDGAAVVLFPRPDTLHEGFATEGLPSGALFSELPLDHHLGSDAGVVGAREPERAAATHATPARENVHLSLVEHVAHVQAARHVGRRQEDNKRLAGRALPLDRCGLGEELFADPVSGPMIFNGGGVVGFGQVVRHWVWSKAPGMCAKSP